MSGLAWVLLLIGQGVDIPCQYKDKHMGMTVTRDCVVRLLPGGAQVRLGSYWEKAFVLKDRFATIVWPYYVYPKVRR